MRGIEPGSGGVRLRTSGDPEVIAELTPAAVAYLGLQVLEREKQAFLADCRVDRRADGLISVLRQMTGTSAPEGAGPRLFPPPFSAN